ncbi:conjugative transfer ATPase%2C PFL_4706 family [Serratia marcescens]|nr:conjugative transfer ATPase%2C PFL_4706 family [Serratia marcescens]
MSKLLNHYTGCYTEGVVLSKKLEALFRAVPPGLYLALGITEKEEKAARKVAQKLDRLRGPAAHGETRAA